jgi:ubiquitin carboxyl-terminal hydrolase 4/11/15
MAIKPSVSAANKPSLDDQIAQVFQLALQPLKDGQKGYVVSRPWLNRVQEHGTQAKKSGKQPKEDIDVALGPLDNAGLTIINHPKDAEFNDEAGEPFMPLKRGLTMGEDFEVIPQQAWELIMKWYGLTQGSPIITRYCHNTSTSTVAENIQVELYPLVFTILKLPDRTGGPTTQKALKEKDARPVRILASRHEGYQKFLKRAKDAAGIEVQTSVRVWRILGGLREGTQAGMLTPAQSRSNSPAPNYPATVEPGNQLVLDVNTFISLQEGSDRELLDVKDETMNAKYNGHSNLDLVGLGQEGVVVLEEQIGGPAGGEWVSNAAASNAAKNGVAISVTKSGSTTVSNALKVKANTSSGRSSPAPGGMMTRGRAQKHGKAKGTVGLGNLGNTCYMNSALQCVRSVEELTYYFLGEPFGESRKRFRNSLTVASQKMDTRRS